MIIDEVTQVSALIGVDAAHGLPHRAVERCVSLGVDPIRGNFGPMIKGRANDAAAVFLRKRDIGFGQRRRGKLAVHDQIQSVARAGRCIADFDALARQKAFQHMQREIVCSGIERDAHGVIGKLLRREHGRMRGDRDGAVGHDGPASDLPAADRGGAGAAVIAPFASIVHVGFALLQQGAMADEWIGALRVGNGRVGGLNAGLVPVRPLDKDSFLLEQTLIVGHELG